MTSEEQNLNNTEIKTGNDGEQSIVEKNPSEKRSERLDVVNRELAYFSNTDEKNIEEIENERRQSFESKMHEIKNAEIPISSETESIIYQNMVNDSIDHAKKENKRFDELKIEKIVLENVGNPNSQFIKRLFPFFPEVSEEVFFDTLEKLKHLDSEKIKISVAERVKIFREAMEFFSTNNIVGKLKHPASHGTGSESLKAIIESGKIKMGGDGFMGEAVNNFAVKSSGYVSVSEMEHTMADATGMFYARMAANNEVSSDLLEIDADAIDNVTTVDDFIESNVASASLVELVDALSKKYKKGSSAILLEISSEAKKDSEEITRDDILHSSLLKNLVLSSLSVNADRKHYPTPESEAVIYQGLFEIIKQCENGDFPKFFLNGKEYQSPQDILDYEDAINPTRSIEEKMMSEMKNHYTYFISENEDGIARYSLEDMLGDKKKEILKGIVDHIKIDGGKFKNTLHALESDSQEVALWKKQLLEKLGNQFPCLMMIESDEYKKNNLTYSLKYGGKPLPWFSVEERILSDIAFSDVKEIVVPRSKIDEVKEKLKKTGIDEKDMPRIVAFEYFEIKRLLNHQAKQGK